MTIAISSWLPCRPAIEVPHDAELALLPSRSQVRRLMKSSGRVAGKQRTANTLRWTRAVGQRRPRACRSGPSRELDRVGLEPARGEVGLVGSAAGVRLGSSGRSRPSASFERGLELRVAGDLRLDLHQPRVLAVEPHQLVVRALLDQPALVEDEDAVGVAQRAQAVGDRDRGAAAGRGREAPPGSPSPTRCRRCWWLRRGSGPWDRRGAPGRSRCAAVRRRRGRRRARRARCRSPAACGG